MYTVIPKVNADDKHAYAPHDDLMEVKPTDLPYITIAGGCFWCTESEFRTLDGVKFTLVGYTGGKTDKPTYDDITTGKTGHAEALQVYYDPSEISEEKLLRFFFIKAHDPTQLNRQGVDVGTQYRSAVFYNDDAQKERIENIIQDIKKDGVYKKDIVTTLEPESTFFVAEEYHQQFYERYEEAYGRPHVRILYKLYNK